MLVKRYGPHDYSSIIVDLLAALALEKEAAGKAAADSGLSTRAFSVLWLLKDDAALKVAGITALDLAKEAEALIARFPNAAVNPDEQRRLRASLYRPLLTLDSDGRARIVDLIVSTLFA
jgi:type I restriction enzyme R subunit